MSNVKQETISGAKWLLLKRCTMQPVQLVFGILLARLISPEEFGILGLTAVFFAIAGQLQDCGFGSALVRDIHRTEKDINTVFWTNMGLSFVLSSLLFLCAPLFVDFFHQPALLWLTRASALMMFLNSTGSVHWTLYTCRRDFKTPAIVNMVCTLCAMPVCLGTAYIGWGYWSLFLQGCTTALLSLGIIWYISPWKPAWSWSRESFTRYFSYGCKLTASGIIDSFFTNSKNLLIGKFYSPADLGLFNRAWGLASAPSSLVNGILGSVTFPILATIQEDETKLLQVYSKYIRITSLPIFFASWLFIALAYPAISLIYGENWLVCAGYLQIVLIGVMSYHYGTINNNLLLVKGRADLVLRLGIIKKIVSFLLLFAGIFISMEAVCWAAVAFVPFSILLNSYYTGKLFNFGLQRQMKDFLPYFIISALCCIPANCITYLPIHPFFHLMLGGVVSTVLYTGILYMKKDTAFFMLLESFGQSKFCPIFLRRFTRV